MFIAIIYFLGSELFVISDRVGDLTDRYNSCAPEIQMFSNFSFLNFVLKLWVVTLYHTDILLRTACAYFFCPNECVAPVCILWNTPLQSRLVENRPPISLIFKFVNHRPPIFYIFYIVHPTQFP